MRPHLSTAQTQTQSHFIKVSSTDQQEMAKLIVLVTLFCFVTMSIEARKIFNETSLVQKFDPLDGNSSIETSVIGPELLGGSVAPPKPPPVSDTIIDNAWPSDPKRIVEKNKWCIAKPSTSETQLGANIKFACNQPSSIVDCKVIKPGGSCFYPMLQ
ncbi:hypothetical protein L6164_013747 [Bauhinia variegata]|uniref:Uncharacterized protein n=1 Tax=Bauhinia variegata TaxID=167791 RepID=A0ACB9NGF1_BAUVA|nr:hypothetical protein L6164_013747 [Bauhinia variegata]